MAGTNLSKMELTLGGIAEDSIIMSSGGVVDEQLGFVTDEIKCTIEPEEEELLEPRSGLEEDEPKKGATFQVKLLN